MPEQNITNIPSSRVEFIDPRTGLISREWYRFFLNLFNLAGAGGNQTSLDDLQLGPPPLADTGTSGGGGSGTVTSVGMSVPTGLSVAGSPVTTSGTFAVTYTAGYAIPTTAKQTEWDTAYADRLKWDGGATDLVAATGRTSLGATTVGSNFFTLTNPSAITFVQINADNTITTMDAPTFRTAIGAGTGDGTVTSVGGTSPVVSSGGTTPAISLATAYGDTLNPYASKTANTFLAAPNGLAGVPTFRAMVATDVPALSYVSSVSGTAGRITSTGGLTPVLDLTSGIATAGTTGSSTLIPVVTIDTYGRVTGITTAANPQGTVTSASVVSANGFAGTVATATTTPAITLTTTITGLLKGNATAISAATAGTDYSAGTSALTTGILKSTTTTGALTIAVAADFPTLNQNTTGTAANVTGTVAIANGGTGQTTQTAAFDALAPTTTKGDLIVFNSTDNIRLPVGTNAYVLTADSTVAAGVKWAAAGGGSNITALGLWENSATISANYTIATGNNAMSAGRISVASGVTVTVPTGSTWAIV